MTPTEAKFFELTNRYEAMKAEMKIVREDMDKVMAELGIGTLHQDPLTGVVYAIEIPSGTFIEYKKISYVRTAKEGESRGTLSKKAAEAAGYRFKV